MILWIAQDKSSIERFLICLIWFYLKIGLGNLIVNSGSRLGSKNEL